MSASRPDTATTLDAEKAALERDSAAPSVTVPDAATSSKPESATPTGQPSAKRSRNPFARRKKIDDAVNTKGETDSEKTADGTPAAPVRPPIEVPKEVGLFSMFRYVGYMFHLLIHAVCRRYVARWRAAPYRHAAV